MLKTTLLVTTLLATTTAFAGEKRWQAESVAFVADPNVAQALKAAMTTWNDVGAGPLLGVDAPSGASLGAAIVARDGVNRAGVLRGPWPFNPMAGAVTTVWSNGDEIVEVDLAVNPRFAWNSGAYDLQDVLTHEVGHVLGLPDVKDSREATMFYLVLPGETLKRDLSKADKDLVLELYDGIDSSSGCNATGKDVSAMTVVALVLLAAKNKNKRKHR